MFRRRAVLSASVSCKRSPGICWPSAKTGNCGCRLAWALGLQSIFPWALSHRCGLPFCLQGACFWVSSFCGIAVSGSCFFLPLPPSALVFLQRKYARFLLLRHFSRKKPEWFLSKGESRILMFSPMAFASPFTTPGSKELLRKPRRKMCAFVFAGISSGHPCVLVNGCAFAACFCRHVHRRHQGILIFSATLSSKV